MHCSCQYFLGKIVGFSRGKGLLIVMVVCETFEHIKIAELFYKSEIFLCTSKILICFELSANMHTVAPPCAHCPTHDYHYSSASNTDHGEHFIP